MTIWALYSVRSWFYF